MDEEQARRAQVRRLNDEYEAALRGFESEGGEQWLQAAHGIGREAIRLGLGVLDVVMMHEHAHRPSAGAGSLDFLAEALSPFEMTHRGFAEANHELVELNQSLQRIVEERTRDVRERQRLSEALNDINGLMRSRGTLEQIMCEVLAKGAETLGADSGSVAVADGPDWVVRYVWGRPRDIEGRRFESGQNRWTQLAIDRGEPVAADDAEWRSDEVASFPKGTSTTVAAPIVVRGRSIAVLHINHENGPYTFSRVEVDFVHKLAASLSLALRDVMTFEAEHRIAEVLQEAILETRGELEGIDVGFCYASATEQARVGGDFYDVFHVQDREVCALIGDVSGKGIEAASMAAMTKNTIRVHAIPGRSPREILRAANESMCRFTAPESFVTVFLALIDLRSGRMRYGSAGHPPGILLRADGRNGLLCLTDAGGPLLAAFADSEFCDRELSLKEADTLVLYTDGVIETRSNGRMLGEEGFLGILNEGADREPTALLESALAEVRRRAGGQLCDDIAMLALRIRTED